MQCLLRQQAERFPRRLPDGGHRFVIEIEQYIAHHDRRILDTTAARACNAPAIHFDLVRLAQFGIQSQFLQRLYWCIERKRINFLEHHRHVRVMKNALIENLIPIEVCRTAAEPATIDGQSAPRTFCRVEDAFENLMIAEAQIRLVRAAQHDGIRLGLVHAFGERVIDRLCLPRRDSAKIN